MRPEHAAANRIAKQAYQIKHGALRVHPGGWVEYSGDVPEEIRKLAENEVAKMQEVNHV